MFENILNDITRLPMDRLRRNLGGHIPSCAQHVRYDAVPWRRPLPSDGRCLATAH